jgi:hypothetical protein
MNIKLSKRVLTAVLCSLLVQFTAQAGPHSAIGQSNDQGPATTSAPQLSPQQIQQLVAPIALYPDALVAQVLAASTYPAEIVEADRWMQSHASLKGGDLAKEVDKQPWDPSVKALTQFPSVLENMDKNLSWTSSLGDAYANQQQDVTQAVQTMRQQARKAGKLNSNEQEKVTREIRQASFRNPPELRAKRQTLSFTLQAGITKDGKNSFYLDGQRNASTPKTAGQLPNECGWTQ